MIDKSPIRIGWRFGISALAMTISPLAVSQSVAPQGVQQDIRIYQTDSIGNTRSHLPSWSIQPDGRVIETNRYGEKMHHKQQYKIVGDPVMPVDSVGNPQPHKGAATRR